MVDKSDKEKFIDEYIKLCEKYRTFIDWTEGDTFYDSNSKTGYGDTSDIDLWINDYPLTDDDPNAFMEYLGYYKQHLLDSLTEEQGMDTVYQPYEGMTYKVVNLLVFDEFTDGYWWMYPYAGIYEKVV